MLTLKYTLTIVLFLFFSFSHSQVEDGSCSVCTSCIDPKTGQSQNTGCCGEYLNTTTTNSISSNTSIAPTMMVGNSSARLFCMTFCVTEGRSCCGCNARYSTDPDIACFSCGGSDSCKNSDNPASLLDKVCVSGADTLQQIFFYVGLFVTTLIIMF
eukprot:TRINITY_DN2123_c0_g1_i1.p1 TRINITY_DN2123_c0_g1~~TRINITY_DN2123_c0_g1_i1.p1  ORF type:complete len:156 (-),score=13.04 TRINITY_DN2123_c0_g1_i1:47-514(-)